MRALVIGGTGPSGPTVVRGLLERGYEVTIYHRGLHETEELPAVHHHLHGDADDPDSLRRDVGGDWDLVCAMYGRDARSEDLFAGRCDRFIYIGGQSAYIRPHLLPFPQGRAFPIRDDHPRYADAQEGWVNAAAVAACERRVMEHHARGDYAATVFTYTSLYGPRAPRPLLWPIVRRILDGRRQIIVPGGGNLLRPMCYAENASRQVLLAIDRHEARGEAFHSVDRDAYYLGDVIQLVAEALGVEVEVVSVNHPYANTLAMGYAPSDNWAWDAAKLTYVLGYSDVVPAAEAIQRTARWQALHRAEIETPMLPMITPDPQAYDIEDRLIASHLEWQQQVTATIPAPPDVRRPHGTRNFRYEQPPVTNG